MYFNMMHFPHNLLGFQRERKKEREETETLVFEQKNRETATDQHLRVRGVSNLVFYAQSTITVISGQLEREEGQVKDRCPT